MLSTVISAVKILLAQGLAVALDEVWFPTSIQRLRQQFAGTATLRVVWLRCERAENRRRDLLRQGGSVMGGRVDTLRQELEAEDWPAYVQSLDSSQLTLEQTVEAINRLPVCG